MLLAHLSMAHLSLNNVFSMILTTCPLNNRISKNTNISTNFLTFPPLTRRLTVCIGSRRRVGRGRRIGRGRRVRGRRVGGRRRGGQSIIARLSPLSVSVAMAIVVRVGPTHCPAPSHWSGAVAISFLGRGEDRVIGCCTVDKRVKSDSMTAYKS